MRSASVVSVRLAVVLVCGAAAGCGSFRTTPEWPQVGRAAFQALTPTTLANCTLKRYGAPNDGGYVMCANLVDQAQAAYSYGIDGRDDWGCDISRQLQKPVHEYDCFNLTRPRCAGGVLQFHEECIGEAKATRDGRPFDTLSDQLAANGDANKHLIVKMDVSGSEWESLLGTPDPVLDRIDQLAIELHYVNEVSERRFGDTLEKLRNHFYVAHVHANNFACQRGLEPFTSWANEVLFVNKAIGTLDLSGRTPSLPSLLDALNNPSKPDCQPTF